MKATHRHRSDVTRLHRDHCAATRRPCVGSVVRLPHVDFRASAFKHGVQVEDIEHSVRNPMAIEELDGNLRLYLGPSRSGTLLEVVVVVREAEPELAIHAMSAREKYRRLLPGED